jgi:hypothetical protein
VLSGRMRTAAPSPTTALARSQSYAPSKSSPSGRPARMLCTGFPALS